MKVLVVVDAQNDFITGSLGSIEAQRVLPNIVKKLEEYDDDLVIGTLDSHNNRYLQTLEGKYLPIEHCIIGTEGWYLEKSISSIISSKYMGYPLFKDTFGSVDLPYVIKSQVMNLKSIELVGYVLDICVISNALLLKAHFQEVPIKVDVSCCAATSPENRDAAIKVLKSCQIEVLNEGISLY